MLVESSLISFDLLPCATNNNIIVYYESLVNITTGMDGKTKTNPMDVTSVTQPVNKEMYVTCY